MLVSYSDRRCSTKHSLPLICRLIRLVSNNLKKVKPACVTRRNIQRTHWQTHWLLLGLLCVFAVSSRRVFLLGLFAGSSYGIFLPSLLAGSSRWVFSPGLLLRDLLVVSSTPSPVPSYRVPSCTVPSCGIPSLTRCHLFHGAIHYHTLCHAKINHTNRIVHNATLCENALHSGSLVADALSYAPKFCR